MRLSVHAATLAASLLITACGQRQLAVVAAVPDPEAAAQELRSETGLEEPLRIGFAWSLNEAGQRLRGRGVARVEPPYKARLDLFLHNNETVLRATLVEGDLRLAAGAPDDILPPPDLMWGLLGIFRPPMGAELLGAERMEGGAMRLRYAYPNRTELHYEVVDGSVQMLELIDRGQVVERLRVEPAEGDRYPAEAVYRNMADFRELTLERESLQAVAPFDADIWDLAQ